MEMSHLHVFAMQPGQNKIKAPVLGCLWIYSKNGKCLYQNDRFQFPAVEFDPWVYLSAVYIICIEFRLVLYHLTIEHMSAIGEISNQIF